MTVSSADISEVGSSEGVNEVSGKDSGYSEGAAGSSCVSSVSTARSSFSVRAVWDGCSISGAAGSCCSGAGVVVAEAGAVVSVLGS